MIYLELVRVISKCNNFVIILRLLLFATLYCQILCQFFFGQAFKHKAPKNFFGRFYTKNPSLFKIISPYS